LLLEFVPGLGVPLIVLHGISDTAVLKGVMEPMTCFGAGGRAFWSGAALCVAFSLLTACGNSNKSNSTPNAASVAGNWQMSLQPSNPNWRPTAQSGFLVENGGAIGGSMMFSDIACSGVGTVAGTVDGTDISFSVTPTGINIQFIGSLTQSTVMSGSYTILSSGCSGVYSAPQTGTFTANLVTPLKGNIQGTFVSHGGVTYPITGQLSQAANTGVSVANLSGTMSTSNYCFFTTTNITGAISGTSVVLNLVGSDGTAVGQISGTTSLDGSLVTGTYRLIGFGPGVGAKPPCVNGDNGTVSFTL